MATLPLPKPMHDQVGGGEPRSSGFLQPGAPSKVLLPEADL